MYISVANGLGIKGTMLLQLASQVVYKEKMVKVGSFVLSLMI